MTLVVWAWPVSRLASLFLVLYALWVAFARSADLGHLGAELSGATGTARTARFGASQPSCELWPELL